MPACSAVSELVDLRVRILVRLVQHIQHEREVRRSYAFSGPHLPLANQRVISKNTHSQLPLLTPQLQQRSPNR